VIGALSAAAEAGYRAGRAGRKFTDEDRAHFRSQALRLTYRLAYRRGRRAQLRFEQMVLALWEEGG